MKCTRIVFVSGILLAGSIAAAAAWQPIETVIRSNENPRKILFIGNSYTAFHDLDAVVRQLAASGRFPIDLQTTRLVKPGQTLQSHYNDPATAAVIVKGQWDLVVLQEQSTRPIQDPPAFYEYAIKLADLIRKAGAKPVFYMTWARQAKPEMTEPLKQAYTRMGRQLDAFVAPAGLAWAVSMKAHPEIALYAEDGSHPSVCGTYLTACVFYATVTGLSPVGLSNAGMTGISPQDTLALQEAAWKAVQAYVREQAEMAES